MNKNKIIFYVIWAALLLLGPISIFSNTNLSLLAGNKVLLANLTQRIFGLAAFTMMFVQIVLGSDMQKWTEKYGPWVLKFHIFEGVLAYSIVLLHPLSFLVSRFFAGQGIDPYFIFVDVCVLCRSPLDYYYSLGRVAFWLLSIAVYAGLSRMSSPFLRMHWKKFHVLNYITFLIVGIHGLSLGTDFRTMPFFVFAVLAYLVVLYVAIFRKIPEFMRNLRLWLS